MTGRRRRRWFRWPVWRDDRGQFAGIEALPFAVLIFVAGSLLAANAWAVVDAKMAVTSASREAVRVYVEAPPDMDAAATAARDAAISALEGYGRDSSKTEIEVINESGAYIRCARVAVEVTHPVPALTLPFIGGFGTSFNVTSRHSEIIDPFRDGVPGTGCA